MNFAFISFSQVESRLEISLIISFTFLLSFVSKLLLCRHLFTNLLRLMYRKHAHGLVVTQNSKAPESVTPLNNVKKIFSYEPNQIIRLPFSFLHLQFSKILYLELFLINAYYKNKLIYDTYLNLMGFVLFKYQDIRVQYIMLQYVLPFRVLYSQRCWRIMNHLQTCYLLLYQDLELLYCIYLLFLE